jgi:hypothetical protein
MIIFVAQHDSPSCQSDGDKSTAEEYFGVGGTDDRAQEVEPSMRQVECEAV